MANMIIKPAADGNLLIQDRAGGAVLSTSTSGATIANATLTTPTVADMTNCTFPAGHVLQTVTAEDIDGTTGTPNSSSNSTSPTWLDVVSVAITPSSGTKCICFVDAIIGSGSTSSSAYLWVRVIRDSTTLGLSSLSSYDWPSLSSPMDTANVHQYSRSAYDTHGANGSTAITYKLQISNQHASHRILAGRSHANEGDSYGSAQSSRIIVMEVK